MDDRAIARWRMRTLRLSAPDHPSAEAVVGALLGVQAENHGQAAWAVATRTTGMTKDEFDRQFDDGVFLRTHLFRPTWHYVLPDDIRWVADLTGPRVRRSYVQLKRSLDMDDDALERAVVVMVDALGDGTHLTRPALAARLDDAGLPAEGPGLGLITAWAESLGLVCSGRMQDGEHTYALVDERAPQARRLDPQEARAELVLRYLSGHGPATERDVAYWASMTLGDVRAGLHDVGGRLESLTVEGRTYWFAEPPGTDAPAAPRGHLLMVLDEYHNGYQDSRYVLDADGVVPRGRHVSMGMAVADTQMVGNMRRTVGAETVTFEVLPFRPLADDEVAALREAAGRYGAFLGREPTLHVGS